MASLWIGSGAGWPLKGLGVSSPDHQVGAHFEALGEGVLMAPSKSIRYFFAISSCLEVRCDAYCVGLFELTDAHRTNAKSRISFDETMIPMVTDKLFRIV